MKTIRPISDPALRVKEVGDDDLIIIMKPIKNELGCVTDYEAKTVQATDFCASIIAKALQGLSSVLPVSDPADGISLWIKDGCLAFASGDASRLGTMPPTAFEKSLREAFKILPTSDPGDGGPWLCGGMLMRGSTSKNED
ncbi:hypothetical protein [Commensalibacter oyaizuii]|uniref:Uncharacterized protein n=1 Tax=Commensalibacter oyaizuii TaxID=3043873 RepID=A0ABT6Q3F8_9PROT|nr:hypothetical protein [Commensalibacter sp. TBRC 16381]MDI2091637.1 hypothetical protein [Commensalibacter sp. TBRC 16381]